MMLAGKLKIVFSVVLALGVSSSTTTGLAGVRGGDTGKPNFVEILVSPDAVVSLPFTPVLCDGYCVACSNGIGHVAATTPPSCPDCTEQDAKEGSGWHSTLCIGDNNCRNHECNPELENFDFAATTDAELLNAVGSALLRNEPNVLSELLSLNPKRLELSIERGAVQMFACDGEVIAHYPINKSFLVALQSKSD